MEGGRFSILTSDMPSLVLKGAKQNREFSRNNYLKFDWRTVSSTRNKLYCWKCLLFTTDMCSVWSRSWYSNLKNLGRALERHKKCQEHLDCSSKFELFGKQRNIASQIDLAYKREIEMYNQKVKENREVIFLAYQNYSHPQSYKLCQKQITKMCFV